MLRQRADVPTPRISLSTQTVHLHLYLLIEYSVAPQEGAQEVLAQQGAAMRMKIEDRWHCTNPACGCEVLVERGGMVEGKNPRCSCGAGMKKKYAPPVLAHLDLLGVEETPEVTARK
jgi:hypothetical protein